MELHILNDRLAISRLPAGSPVPPWVGGRDLIAVVRTRNELSIVCDQTSVPADVSEVQRGFRALLLAGSFDFSETGVIAKISGPLAAAGVPMFDISTYDTDYVLVSEEHLETAKRALTAAGMRVIDRSDEPAAS